jgi:hypothetical protein
VPDTARGEIERRDLDVASAVDAVGAGTVGDGADQHVAGGLVDDRPLVLESGPGPVIVEKHQVAGDVVGCPRTTDADSPTTARAAAPMT